MAAPVTRAVGLGAMRLSEADVPEARALDVLRAALDAGVNLIDTAAAYGARMHDNERLVARATAERRSSVRVVTKCGMRRPKGAWVPDGRRKTILAQAEASCEALGGPPDLLLLHAPDPSRAFETSVRALRSAQERGLATRVGLSNVRLGELRRALTLTDVAAVQVALSPFDDEAVCSGVVEACLARGVEVLAHSPLGGPKRAGRLSRSPTLSRLAEARGIAPQALALSWLYDLHPSLVPLPGARRVASAESCARAADLTLADHERAALDEAWALGRMVRTTRAERAVREGDAEVVVFVGVPAAGKTGVATRLAEEGFLRLSRDERGGTLRGLNAALAERLAGGATRVLMDATHVTRAIRSRALEAAWAHGARVRCVWLDTPLHEAQLNALHRMIDRVGRVLDPEELDVAGKTDPNLFGPRVPERFQRRFEPPELAEGFVAVERVPFARAPATGHDVAGWVVDLEALITRAWPGDGTEPRLPSSLRSLEVSAPVLVVGWRPGLKPGTAPTRSLEDALRGLGLVAELRLCPHAPGPIRCWCQRPMAGLVVPWMRAHRVDPRRSRYLAVTPSGRALAERLGMQLVEPP